MVLGRDQQWHGNGLITTSKDEKFRMVVLEVELVRSILAGMRGMLGDYTDNLVMHGKRKYVRRYVDGLLSGPLGLLVRSRLGTRKVYENLVSTGATLGYGYIEIMDYERKKGITGLVKNCYAEPLFAGDVSGAFESVERVLTNCSWETEGDASTFIVTTEEREDEMKERMEYEPPKELPSTRTLERCSGCGVPTGMARYKWIEKQGIILDSITNTRVCIMGLNDLNAIFHEVENAVGDEINTVVYKVSKEFAMDIYKGVKKEELDNVFDLWALHGLGNVVEHSEKHLKMDNPYNPDLIRGRVEGLYSALMGKDIIADQKLNEGVIEFTMGGA